MLGRGAWKSHTYGMIPHILTQPSSTKPGTSWSRATRSVLQAAMQLTQSSAPTAIKRVRPFNCVLLSLLLVLTVECAPALAQQLTQIIVPVDGTLVGVRHPAVSSPMPETINKTQLDSATPAHPVTAVAPQLPPG